MPDHDQVRLNGLTEALHAATPDVGFLLGGVVASAASPRAAYAVAGLGALGVLMLSTRVLCGPRATRPVSAHAGAA